eukprot:gene15374-20726_t
MSRINPINTRDVNIQFSIKFWKWVCYRRLFINHLRFSQGILQIQQLIFKCNVRKPNGNNISKLLCRYITSLTSTTKHFGIYKSWSIGFAETFPNVNHLEFQDDRNIGDFSLRSLGSGCLKSITLSSNNVFPEIGLFGVLEVNQSSLTFLEFRKRKLSYSTFDWNKLDLPTALPNLSELHFDDRFMNRGKAEESLGGAVLPNLTSLNVTNSVFGKDFSDGQCLLGLFPPSLTTINISNITASIIQAIFNNNRNYSNLTELIMTSSCKDAEGYETMKSLPSLPPSLTNLDLNRITLLNIHQLFSNGLPNLQVLNLNGITSWLAYNTKDWIGLLSPTITSLNLSGSNITDKILNDLFSTNNLSNLLVLDLRDNFLCGNDLNGVFPESLTVLDLSNSDMECDGLYNIFFNNNLSNLTELDISETIGFGENYIPPLPSSITDLNLSFMKNLTGNSLRLLIISNNYLLNLTTLDISENKLIDGSGLAGILPQSLVSIDISNCSSIAYYGLIEIFSKNYLPYLTIIIVKNLQILKNEDVISSFLNQPLENIQFEQLLIPS